MICCQEDQQYWHEVCFIYPEGIVARDKNQSPDNENVAVFKEFKMGLTHEHTGKLGEQHQHPKMGVNALKEAGHESWDAMKAGYEKIRQEMAESLSKIKPPS